MKVLLLLLLLSSCHLVSCEVLEIACDFIEKADYGVQCNFIGITASERTELIVKEENRSIEAVIFRTSQMSEIPSSVFEKFPYLKYLDIESAKLNYLNKESFQNADRLKYLLARLNDITELTEETFIHCQSLKLLALDYNKISSIHSRAFQGLKKLEGLFLAWNNLKTLPATLFTPLVSLEALRLSYNSLSLINDIFSSNGRLQVIDLSNNNLWRFDEKQFKKLPYLEEFNVANNHFEKLDLTHCRSTEINLVNNQMTDLALNKWNMRFYGSGNPIKNLTLHEHYGMGRTYNFSFSDVTTITFFVNENCCFKEDLESFPNMVRTVGDLSKAGLNENHWRCKLLKTLGYQTLAGMIVNVECRKFNEELLDSDEELFGPFVTIDYSELNIETLTEEPRDTEVFGDEEIEASVIEIFPTTTKSYSGIWKKIKHKASGWKNKFKDWIG